MFDEAERDIRGASSPGQLLANLRVANLPALLTEQMQAVREVADRKIWSTVHYER